MTSAPATHYAVTMTSPDWESHTPTDNNVTWCPPHRPEAEMDWTAGTTARAVLEAMTLCVFFALSLVGNILVCLVIHRSRRLQSTTNYFVVSLAAGDLLLTVVVMPFALTHELAELLRRTADVAFWPSAPACKFIRFCQQLVLGSTSSSSSSHALPFKTQDRRPHTATRIDRKFSKVRKKFSARMSAAGFGVDVICARRYQRRSLLRRGLPATLRHDPGQGSAPGPRRLVTVRCPGVARVLLLRCRAGRQPLRAIRYGRLRADGRSGHHLRRDADVIDLSTAGRRRVRRLHKGRQVHLATRHQRTHVSANYEPRSTRQGTTPSLWGSMAWWLAHLEFQLAAPGSIPGSCATIPLGSNLSQVVYSHCLPSFSAPRNWGTTGSFRRPPKILGCQKIVRKCSSGGRNLS